ncbi:hypothetical protein [Microbacterium marinilacus]|uniref:hypothetical protein n=1 Tax=Microbacterium marinilacus TaxID=415209 RepID=UPI001C8DE222|nr:hypothetical protein [Microbacterium marinilacus]MBY0690509.1 hypothetical protein [Microbacterium marinilacus]
MNATWITHRDTTVAGLRELITKLDAASLAPDDEVRILTIEPLRAILAPTSALLDGEPAPGRIYTSANLPDGGVLLKGLTG